MGGDQGGNAGIAFASADDARDLQAAVRCISALCELKRIHLARARESVADWLFRTAWSALCAGDDSHDVGLRTTARALIASKMGGIDAAFLHSVGLDRGARDAILLHAFDQAMEELPPWPELRGQACRDPETSAHAPGFVDRLARQPRAGATAHGKPWMVMEPSESHASHCLVVAVGGVLLARREQAEIEPVFLAGLAHHLHNAELPDSGFAGELLLGDQLGPIMQHLFAREIGALPERLGAETREALAAVLDASTPEGRAFHSADVFDRVLQVRYYDRVARFRAEQALDDMELVHAGPLQAFHHAALRAAGLL